MTTTSTPIIDPEFKELIPPLSPDERKTLEESIKREGCHTAIVLWNGIVIDGHNRLEICTKNSLPYSIVEKDFPDRLAARIWILNNQLGRRNLSKTARMDLALELKSEMQTEGQIRMKAGKAVDPVKKSAQGKTRDNLAKASGVSHDTLTKWDNIKATAAPEVVEAVRAGKISINAAAKAVKATAAPKQVKVTSESKPAQVVTSKPIKWHTENSRNCCAFYGCHPHEYNVKIQKMTVKGEAVFEVRYGHFDRKDKAATLEEAKVLGETFIGWRAEAARRAGR